MPPRIYGDWRDFQPGGAYYDDPAATGPAAAGTPQPADPYLNDQNEVLPDGTVVRRGYNPANPTGGQPTPPTTQPTQTVAPNLTDFGGGDPAQQQRQIADARGGMAPLGFQQGKWNNQDWNTTKYRAGTILAGGGNIANVLADPLFKGWSAEGTDKIKSPDGNIYDLYYDFGGPNQRVQYTQVGFGPKSDPRLLDNIKGNYRPKGGGAQSGVTRRTAQPSERVVGGPSGPVQRVGTDPFSQLIDLGYADLLAGGPRHSDQSLARSVEAARMPYEIARRSQLANARADLANRGTLGEPGHASGLETAAIQRIEEGLAPAYTGAINDRMLDLDRQAIEQERLFLDTLQAGTNRQVQLSQVALDTLNQNRLWNQFLAEFGLDREKTLWDMAHGNTEQYLKLLDLWLRAADQSADGFI